MPRDINGQERFFFIRACPSPSDAKNEQVTVKGCNISQQK